MTGSPLAWGWQDAPSTATPETSADFESAGRWAAGIGASGLQNGVIGSGDLLISGISISAITGAITFSVAAANPAWVKSASGLLVPVSYTADTRTLTPSGLPVSGSWATARIEMDATGALTATCGASTVGTASGSTILSGTTTGGTLKIADIGIANVANSYVFSNNGVVAQGTNWFDRRPWARGAFAQRGPYTGGNFTPANGAVWAGGALQLRVECSGVPMRMSVSFGAAFSANNGFVIVAPYVDGAQAPDGDTGTIVTPSSALGFSEPFAFAPFAPSVGSHLVEPRLVSQSSLTNLYGTVGDPVIITLEEIVRPFANNGIV